ncbi:MAG: hypothetical protein K6B75_04145, partial [Lachnospiraceae bacterium]|nr:hypothetical protein [Lachnospiraceae bacterium]
MEEQSTNVKENAIKKGFKACARNIADIGTSFKDGDWATRISFVIMGFGNLVRGQVLRGILFFLFEIVFILYMVFFGGYYISMLPSLGLVGPGNKYNELY